MLPAASFAQATVTTQITPPYNVPLGDLKFNITTTIFSATLNGDHILKMTISGDNGVLIESNSNNPFFVVIIQGVPQSLSGADLNDLFLRSNLNFTNVSSIDVYNTGLPPGNYSVCFRLWDADANPVSGAPPSGCASFSIAPPTVTITTVIIPPYTEPLNDLQDNITVTINSNYYVDDPLLSVSITGNNGVSIQTDVNNLQVVLPPIDVNEPLILNGADFDQLFNAANLVFTGITAATATTTGLPPGQYQLCFRLWRGAGDPITGAPPTGCTSFSITAPVLTFTLNTRVVPPFTSRLEDYPGKTMVMLHSSADKEVYFRMQMKGNNGVTITTMPGFVPTSLLSLQAGVPYTASGLDLEVYFDFSNLQFAGISKAETMNTGLPEGDYQICFVAYDADGNALSADAPYGCSNTFSIRDLQPPVLLRPQCGKVFDYAEVPNILFGWTPSPGAPATTVYTLKIAEFPTNTMNPSEVMETATTPAFFEQDVTGVTFLYGPGLSMLEKGKKYAFQLIAHDDVSKARFANGGRSEVCWFQYGKEELPQKETEPAGATYYAINDLPVTVPGQPFFAPISKVSGRLKYTFPPDGLPKKSTGSGGVTQINQNSFSQMQVADQYILVGMVDPVNSRPLKNTRVSLVVTYVVKDAVVTGGKDQNYAKTTYSSLRVLPEYSTFLNQFTDLNKVVATTYTDADGNFTFTFVSQDSTGLVQKNFEYTAYFIVPDKYGGPPHKVPSKSVTGDLYRVFRVVVEDEYYCSPDYDIIVQPWQQVNVGTLVSYAKSYNLDLSVISNPKIKDQKYGQGNPLDAVKAYVVRLPGKRPANVPLNEGQNLSEKVAVGTLGNWDVVAKGVTSENNEPGHCIFTNLMRHYGYNQDDHYFMFLETSKTKGEVNYKSALEVYPKFMYYFDNVKYPMTSSSYGAYPSPGGTIYNITFNSEYEVKTYAFQMIMDPDYPRVFGRVMHENSPIAGATIFNWDTKDQTKLQGKSDNAGYFEFNNLPPNKAWNTIVEKYGYETVMKTSEQLQMGQQKNWGNIILKPMAYVRGEVIDENGAAVHSDVKLGFSPFKETQPLFTINPFSMKEVFSFPAASGIKQDLIIIPPDEYFPDTFKVDVLYGQMNDLGKFKVYRKLHRMKFTVDYEYVHPQSKQIMHGAIPGAKVKILDMVQVADQLGNVQFEFANASDYFLVEVIPPDGSEYVATSFWVHNPASKYPVSKYVYLQKGAVISGTVTAGPDHVPVEGARVFLDMGSGSNSITTFSKADGSYTLAGIPIGSGKQLIKATKAADESTTYIGESKEVALPTAQPVNFNLKIADVSLAKIWGMPVELESLEKLSSGEIKVSGAFVQLADNPNFQLENKDTRLSFSQVTLKSVSGKWEPVAASILTDGFYIKLKMFNAFRGKLMSSDPKNVLLSVYADTQKKGMLRGKVQVDQVAFDFVSTYLAFNQGTEMLLSEWGKTKPEVIAFRAPGVVYPKQKFGLVNSAGGDMKMKIHNFNAIANKDSSYIYEDNIALYAILSTAIPNMVPADLKIDAGKIIIKPNSITAFKKGDKLKFKLEKWDVIAEGWEYRKESGSLVSYKGMVVTGLVDVPVTYMEIKPTSLDLKYDIKSLSLSGVVPVQVMTQNPSKRFFGYDPVVGEDKKGHWVLTVLAEGDNPAAVASGLPGTPDKLYFGSFQVISNGETQFSGIKATPTFYNVMKMTVTSLTTYSDFFLLSGKNDLGIPGMPTDLGVTLRFRKVSGKPVLEIIPMKIEFNAKGGVSYSADVTPGAQTLDEKGFFTSGDIIVKDKGATLKIKGKLSRTPSFIRVDVDPKGQTIYFGSNSAKTKMTAVEGDMVVMNNAWDYFRFNGILEASKGVEQPAGKRTYFTAYGAINTELNKESIKVSNINTPFGVAQITFDLKTMALYGHIDINKVEIAGLVVDGGMDMRFEQKGWDFLGIADVTVPVIQTIKCGILFGNYPTANKDVLIPSKFTSLPEELKNGINGFFFTGYKSSPIELPNFDIDVAGIISAGISATGGLAAKVWMDFDSPQGATVLGVGAVALAEVELYIKSKLTCSSMDVGASLQAGFPAGTFNVTTKEIKLTGCNSFSVHGSVEQCADLGLCKGCWSDGYSKGFAVLLTVSTKDGFDFEISDGKCTN